MPNYLAHFIKYFAVSLFILLAVFFYPIIGDAAFTPITVTLQPGASTTISANGPGWANYIVALNPAVPSSLVNMSVFGGLQNGVTQVTNGSSACPSIPICQLSFNLSPGGTCCLQLSFSGANMQLGKNIIAPLVATNPPTYQGRASALAVTVTKTLDYWVATNGNDSGSGSFTDPFLTIQHAQAVIRNHTLRGIYAFHVYIKDGTYLLSTPLLFDQNDSGSSSAQIVYQAGPGANPIISGGQKITGWTLHDSLLNIWQAQTSVSTTLMPRQFYVNGKRATRARTAFFPNYYTRSSTGYTYNYISGSDPQYPPNWSIPTAVEAVTATQWKMMRCPVQQVNGGSDVMMQTPCWTNAGVYPSPWNFQLLSWFENAYEYLSHPGDWFLDPSTQIIYYIPRAGDNMNTADAELPVLEALIQAAGSQTSPVQYLSFQGLTFMYATWLEPSSSDGYVCDQSGFHLLGPNHAPNTTGHDPNVVRTPGNVSFTYAQHISITNNVFTHLGAVALDFGTGSQSNSIINNTFRDISSAGIQMGGVSPDDAHPNSASQLTSDNLISNNLVEYTGQEFYDAAGIFVGVTARTKVEHNDILHVPWSGIAIGWGWGLADLSGFPGLPHAIPMQWSSTYNNSEFSTAQGNQITSNKIEYFLEQLWDGGAIYSTGFQGMSPSNGQYIAYNVAENKQFGGSQNLPSPYTPFPAGGNTFYTDGGSRYIKLQQNVSLNNPQGYFNLGPCGKDSSFSLICMATGVDTYGADMGGCIPYGDLTFIQNYLGDYLTFYQNSLCFNTYVPNNPVNLVFNDNIKVTNSSQVPASILNSVGRQ